jgi:hypothetical protein
MTGNQHFTVLPEHLTLLRRAFVSWDGCEYGAPAIDCKRPYGNGDVPDDIRELLSAPQLTDAECRELHEGTKTALQIVLVTGSFQAGDYRADKYTRDWEPVPASEAAA